MEITEYQLKSFIRCPKSFTLGDSFEGSMPLKIAQQSYELLTALTLRNGYENPAAEVFKIIPKITARLKLRQTYLDAEVDIWENQALRLVGEVLLKLPPSQYHIIYSAIPWRIKLGDTSVICTTSSTLRTVKNTTIHGVYFSPYATAQDMLNDPIVHMLNQTLRQYTKNSGFRPNSRLHIFGVNTKGDVYYNTMSDKELTPDYLKAIKSISKAIEGGYSYPAVPCPNKDCQFRKTCFPRTL